MRSDVTFDMIKKFVSFGASFRAIPVSQLGLHLNQPGLHIKKALRLVHHTKTLQIPYDLVLL